MDKRNPVKNTLRIALPPLAQWSDTTPLAYAWIDRQGRVARGGTLTAAELAAAFANTRAQVVLHPEDVIMTTIAVPAVPANRYAAAIHGILEGLVLQDIESLAIGHSQRTADGQAQVAWTPRNTLRDAWQRLSAAGLTIQAFYPLQVWSDAQDADLPAPLTDTADLRWLSPSPTWSLAIPQLAPRQRSRWRGAAGWVAGAALIWVIGLNLYAAQLERETEALKQRMEHDVRDAFPEIPVVLDPVRQAQQGRDALRTGQGDTSGADLLSLARIAAQVLPFAADTVDILAYQNEILTLTLNDGTATTGASDNQATTLSADAASNATKGTRPNTTSRNTGTTPAASATSTSADRMADTASILQRAATLGARVERDDNGAWRITRAEP